MLPRTVLNTPFCLSKKAESDTKKITLFFILHSCIKGKAKKNVREYIHYFLVHSYGRVNSNPKTSKKHSF